MLLAIFLILSGCSSDETEVVDPCTAGELSRIVITGLAYTLPDENDQINGFDLDKYVTEIGDDEGCGHEDMTSPNGIEGIDSAWSRLAPVLDSIGASQIQDYLQAAIDNGDLLIVMEFSGLNGPLGPDLTDECAMLTLRRGSGTPLMGNDGTILADQTFYLDTEVPSTNTVPVTFESGVMTAHGVDMTLPVQLLDEYVTLILNQSSLQFEILEDHSVHGFFAGGLPIDALKERIAEINDIGDLQEAIPAMVESAADLFPDDSDECTEISLGLDFVGKNTYFFDE
jgi:hypothetical protein